MDEFKIAAAQVVSVRGDVERNIETHKNAISSAAYHGISVVIFPELSLIGYEPELAASHAIAPSDVRLRPLADLAERYSMHIVVGASLSNGETKPKLGAIHFGPEGTLRTYAKMHLGGIEPLHFSPGHVPVTIESHEQTIGLSICADSSRPSHPQAYKALGASVYAAGVFLNAEWFATDAPRLASYAFKHQMLVVMANHANSRGTYISVGNSAIWAPDGRLLAQANGTQNAFVVATKQSSSWRGDVIELSC